MTQLLAALAVDVEILGHGRRIERGAVGERHALTQLEDILRPVGVEAPALGEPRLDLQRLRILVGQLVRDLIEHAAVRIETAGRRIEIGVSLLLEIDQPSAGDGRGPLRLHGSHAAAKRHARGQRRSAGEKGTPGRSRGSQTIRHDQSPEVVSRIVPGCAGRLLTKNFPAPYARIRRLCWQFGKLRWNEAIVDEDRGRMFLTSTFPDDLRHAACVEAHAASVAPTITPRPAPTPLCRSGTGRGAACR